MAWLLKPLVLLLLAAALLLMVLDQVFNLQSNATFLAFRASTKSLEVKTAAGNWKPLNELTIAELDRALTRRIETPGAVWKSLTVRRQAENFHAKSGAGISQREDLRHRALPTVLHLRHELQRQVRADHRKRTPRGRGRDLFHHRELS